MSDVGAGATWVALLRGINVGRNKRVAMADLRALLSSLGYGDVRTYLQSGNAVFTVAGATEAAKLEQAISAQIAADLGLDVAVLVRTGSELVAVADGNPFVDRTSDGRQLHVAFLSAAPSAEAVAGLDPEAYLPDELVPRDRELYLFRPNGIMGSRLPNWERMLDVRVTERNWNTVTQLRALVG